jgi:hypothetical protein
MALIEFYVARKDIESEEFHSSETMVTTAPFVVIAVFLTGFPRGIFPDSEGITVTGKTCRRRKNMEMIRLFIHVV